MKIVLKEEIEESLRKASCFHRMVYEKNKNDPYHVPRWLWDKRRVLLEEIGIECSHIHDPMDRYAVWIMYRVSVLEHRYPEFFKKRRVEKW